MRHTLLAAAGSALLLYAPAAWAQLDTSADAYRRMNDEPVAPSAASTTPYYGDSGNVMNAPGGRDGDGGWFGNLSIITPNDPAYSYSAPPHRGQPMLWELNGNDHGAGTSYPSIYSIDGGNGSTGG